MATQNPKPSLFKIVFALTLGFGSALAWIVYAELVYKNQIPVQDFEFHGMYPLSIGVAAILTALLFDRNLKSLALGLPPRQFWAEAVIYAVALTFMPFLLNLLVNLTGLPKTPAIYTELVLIGLPFFVLMAISEELMWRGILYTEISKFLNFPATCIIIGLLWSAWHYPVIIRTKLLYSDRPLYFVLPMFTIMVTFSSFIYGYLRKFSGSIWPCVLLHGLENWLFYTLIQPLERAKYPWSAFFLNDIGFLYVLAAVMGGMYFYHLGKSNKPSVQ